MLSVWHSLKINPTILHQPNTTIGCIMRKEQYIQSLNEKAPYMVHPSIVIFKRIKSSICKLPAVRFKGFS